MSRSRRAGGMTLIEALVALTLLGLVLLLGLTAAVLCQRGRQRLEAQQRGLQALEAVAESLRAGALPLQSGPPEWLGPPPPGLASDLALTLEVAPGDAAGLYQVAVTARFLGPRPPPPQRLVTLVWRAAEAPSWP